MAAKKPLAVYSGTVKELVSGDTLLVALDALSDVTAPTPTNGQVLTWNGSAWVNSTPSAGGTNYGLLNTQINQLGGSF